MDEDKIAAALDRVALAIERLADAYLYCHQPGVEDDEAAQGQSLSDVVPTL